MTVRLYDRVTAIRLLIILSLWQEGAAKRGLDPFRFCIGVGLAFAVSRVSRVGAEPLVGWEGVLFFVRSIFG